MKKDIFVTTMVAAAALILSVSCVKQEQLASKTGINTADKTFTATIEQEFTRTTLTSEYKVNWESADSININGAVYCARPKLGDATKADFTKVSGSEPSAPYAAIYPASLCVIDHFEFPAEQTYVAGEFNAPMYAESTTKSLSFKNICGVICFSLKGVDKVKSIAVIAKEAICGEFIMTDATTMLLSGTDKTVTLDCGDGVQLNETTATDFYLYLPPRTSYAAGMKIIITNTNNQIITKTTTKAVQIKNNNVYTFVWTINFGHILPDGALPGEFSVSDKTKIHFSKGNLQATYDGTKYNWGFANKQYEQIGNAAGNISIGSQSYGAVVDLFGWSTSSTEYGINTSKTAGKYNGDFKDWGIAYCESNGISSTNKWRTLSSEEWTYLFHNRKVNGGFGKNKSFSLNVVYGGVLGVIFYPDTYTGPILSGVVEDLPDGIVFLPAAGSRKGLNVQNSGNDGYYWSSTKDDNSSAFNVFFANNTYNSKPNCSRWAGLSVRLVIESE